jgi:diguanylate cyclase (GGDEF)-like protein
MPNSKAGMAGYPESGVVLVVEDDDSIRLLLREMLRTGGFAAVEAASGEAALDLALEHLPDAVLLDIGLPGIDGLTVLERIKSEPLLARIPVLMVTAWSEPKHVQRAMHAGAHDYVRKPFDTTELIARVEAAVRIKAKHDADRAVHAGTDSSVDALTGLPNRRALENRLADAAAADQPLAVLLLDVDDLETVNMVHGRAAGDAVLCDVAARLRAEATSDQVPGRWDEDAFMVISPGLDGPGAEALAGRLRETIERRPVAIPGGFVELSASVGWAAGSGEAPASMTTRADAALADTKAARRASSRT